MQAGCIPSINISNRIRHNEEGQVNLACLVKLSAWMLHSLFWGFIHLISLNDTDKAY